MGYNGVFDRVNPPGQPSHDFFFFFQPASIPVSGWPGPGSTRRAGPHFKTMQKQLGIGL